jgi:hypothetical protein
VNTTAKPITSADRLREMYAKAAEWPERRGDPMIVGATGFMDLLALRNEVPAILSDHDRLIEKNRRMQEALAAIRRKIAEQSPESIACVQGMEEIDDLAQTALTEDGNG